MRRQGAAERGSELGQRPRRGRSRTCPGGTASVRRLTGWVATTALLVGAVTSCGGTQPVGSTGRAKTVVVKDGTLVFAAEKPVQSFNLNTPQGASFWGQLVMDRVWPQTFLVDPQLNPVLDQNFVESAELVSVDPETIVYKLNPKAVWSDGVPITADDFVYNWKAQSGSALDVGGQPFLDASHAGYQDIRSVTGSDGGHTVTVVFSQPFGDWRSLFNNLIPAHIARKVGWNHGFDTYNPQVVISGGPYMVTSASSDQVVLSRNPRYWGPPAKLAHIVVVTVGDSAGAASSLVAGGVGLIYPSYPSAAIYQQVKADRSLRTEVNLGMRLEEVSFNQRNVFLADPKVRQALAMGTDRKALIDQTVGQVEPSVKPAGNNLFVSTEPFYQDDSGSYSYDAQGAKSSLQQQGFQMGPDGYFERGGKPLEMRVSAPSDDPVSVTVEAVWIQQMKAIGVKVDPLNVDSQTLFSTLLPQGNFDVAIYDTRIDVYKSHEAARFETASPVAATGQQDYTGYSNAQVDTWFQQASQQLNEAKAAALYNQIDQQLWADMVALPLFQLPTLLSHAKAYEGIADNTSYSGPFWDAEVWLEKRVAPGPARVP
jgi:peptide/nickel transport system substrate-binding protein